MKTRFRLNLTLTALASMAMSAVGQYVPIEGPPSLIDYQGRVLDSVGDPVAMGTTENIEMYFRIWDHISDAQPANLRWAEKQIVTVADGNFSVRLGEGDQIQSSAGDNVVSPGNDDPRPSLLTIFGGKDRFLGVSVAANSTVKPASEIQPRLAFLTSPFSAVAEKARFAEFGPSSGTFEATKIGIGTSTPGSLLEVDGINALSAGNGSGLISAGAFGGNHIALDADDIQSYSDGDSPGVLKLNDHGGDINIGSIGSLTTIEGQLSVFGGGQGGVFRVYDNAPVSDIQLIAGLDAAFGVNGAQLRFEGDALPIEIGQNAAGDFVVESNNNVSRFVVQQGGNVGIGPIVPAEKLTIGGSASNVLLSGGDLKLTTRSGGTIFTWFDPGIQWVDHLGAVSGQMFRWGSFNRIHVSSTPSSLSPGVFLLSGNSSWSAYSDESLKSDIQPLTGILDKIKDIRVVGFNMASMKVDDATGKPIVDRSRPLRKTKSGKLIKHEIGTIAQDWLESFPELVSEPQNGDDHYGLSYDRIGVVAIGAAQELNARLEVQEELLKARDKKIIDLEARLARLEALMSATK